MTPAIPVTAGGLTPQLPHQFAVFFRATVKDGIDPIQVKPLLEVLTNQLAEVQLPELAFGGYAGKPPTGEFAVRRHKGAIKFKFQEDTSGQVSKALEMLTDGSVVWLAATICKFSKDKTVIEAFDIRDLDFASVQYSALSYSSRLNISPDNYSSQTVTALAELILAARYQGGKSINEILGDF